MADGFAYTVESDDHRRRAADAGEADLGPWHRTDLAPGADDAGRGNGVMFAAGRFPSLMDDNGRAYASDFLDSMEEGMRQRAVRLHAEGKGMEAGVVLADIDSMRSAYRDLVTGGHSERDAASLVGTTGSVFGTYANAASNARYVQRFAETRGFDFSSAARELAGVKANYRAHYLQRYGFQASDVPDPSFDENINWDFSDLLGAIRDVEDRYGWQFNRETYLDVASRLAAMTADLNHSNVRVGDVGASVLVESALMANGALRGDPNANPASRLLAATVRDRSRITTFGEEGGVDPYSNPYRAGPVDGVSRTTGAMDDSLDFGLARDIRKAVFDHRARCMRSGLAPEDGSNTYPLVSDIAAALRAQSASSGGVSDDTFSKLARRVVGKVFDPTDAEMVSVVGEAQRMAEDGSLEPEQVAALGRWAKGLVMDSKDGQARLSAIAVPYVLRYAASAGLSTKDPLVTEFSRQVYRMLRREYQSLATSYGLDGIDVVSQDPDRIYAMIESKLKTYTAAFEKAGKAKLEAVENRAAAAAKGRDQY